MRVGNLNAEGHIFTAEIAFCHVSHLLVYSLTEDILADFQGKCKHFFSFLKTLLNKAGFLRIFSHFQLKTEDTYGRI